MRFAPWEREGRKESGKPSCGRLGLRRSVTFMRYCVTVVRMLLKLRVSVTWELHTLGLWLPQLVAAEERSRGWAFMRVMRAV
jgi:hypothetical protein